MSFLSSSLTRVDKSMPLALASAARLQMPRIPEAELERLKQEISLVNPDVIVNVRKRRQWCSHVCSVPSGELRADQGFN